MEHELPIDFDPRLPLERAVWAARFVACLSGGATEAWNEANRAIEAFQNECRRRSDALADPKPSTADGDGWANG